MVDCTSASGGTTAENGKINGKEAQACIQMAAASATLDEAAAKFGALVEAIKRKAKAGSCLGGARPSEEAVVGAEGQGEMTGRDILTVLGLPARRYCQFDAKARVS